MIRSRDAQLTQNRELEKHCLSAPRWCGNEQVVVSYCHMVEANGLDLWQQRGNGESGDCSLQTTTAMVVDGAVGVGQVIVQPVSCFVTASVPR